MSTPHTITTGIVRVVTNDKGDVVERVVVGDVSPTGHAWTETTQIPVGDGEWWNIEIRRISDRWSR